MIITSIGLRNRARDLFAVVYRGARGGGNCRRYLAMEALLVCNVQKRPYLPKKFIDKTFTTV
jgi:hypothetical protein